MRKTYNYFARLFIATLICISVFSPVVVKAKSDDTTTLASESYYMAYNENGDLISYNLPNYVARRTGNHTVLTALDHGHKDNVDSGYHPNTSIWRKVSSYGFNTSSTVNVSVGFQANGRWLSGSIGVSVVNSTSFSYQIQVDQSRFSKLRVYTGFDWTYYKAEVIDNTGGNVVNTYYFTYLYKTHEEFRPVYQ